MRFCSLASGSKGNAYLVDDAGELILIDCGIGLRTLKTRMALAGVAIDDITAVLIMWRGLPPSSVSPPMSPSS